MGLLGPLHRWWDSISGCIPSGDRTQCGRKWWRSVAVQMVAAQLAGIITTPMKARATTDPESISAPRQPASKKYGLSNLLACFRIIFYQDAFLTLWIHGSFYTVAYSFVAAAPDIWKDVYHWNELQVGLSYLPRGVSIITGSYFTGKLMDYNYRAIARQTGWTINEVSGDDLLKFPIESARTRHSYIMRTMSIATMLGYGWSVHSHAHPAIH
jgi:hypothetical protein